MIIYELTTNGQGGYRKYYVVGIKNKEEAKKLAKDVFQDYYWENGITEYDTIEDAKKRSYYKGKYWMTKSEFKKKEIGWQY